jgi:hypothetical protein
MRYKLNPNYQTPKIVKPIEEIWRPIIDYPNYMVSNWGRVKSLEREILKSDGHVQMITAKILKDCPIKGYNNVNLYNNKRAHMHRVSKLVWGAFGDEPKGNKQIDHINNNTNIDWITNLQLLTPRQNTSKFHATVQHASSFLGVTYETNKTTRGNKRWRSRIKHNGKTIHLGRFHTEVEAALVYEKYKIANGC